MRHVMTALRWILGILLTLILLVNLTFIGMRLAKIDDNPKLFGFCTALVMSGSMEPEFSVGDLLLYREQDGYQVGDVVMFRAGGSFVTHRIVGEDPKGFITQGDANNTPDVGVLDPANIEGRYLCVIPLAGAILSFCSTTLGAFTLVVFGLLCWELPDIERFLKKTILKRGKFEKF